MFKKMIVLATAVGVVAVLALPASVSASWEHEGQTIQQDVQFSLTGKVRFDTGNGSGECQMTAQIKLFATQTTGALEVLKPHPTSATANCFGIGGYAFCQTHNMTPQEFPWTIHTSQVETTSVTIDGPETGDVTVKGTGVFHDGFVITTKALSFTPAGTFCPGKQILFTEGTIAAIPDKANEFSSVQLNGTVVAHKQLNGGGVLTENVKITGTLQIEDPEQRSTYSL